MFTFPKAVSAVWFAFVAFFASGLVVQYMEDGTQLGLYYYVTAGVGAAMGWRFMGERAYEPFTQVIGFALSTCVLIIFWSLLIFGGYEMYENSIKLRYDGPGQAMIGWVEQMVAYGHLMAKPDVGIALVIGGVVGGWIIWFFAQRTS